MEDFATIAPNSQMTTHVKGLQQNVGKTEIEMSHSDRKWNYLGISCGMCTEAKSTENK